MELRDFGRLFVRGLPLIAACALVGLLLALSASLLRPSTYEATARVFVSTRTASGVQDLNSGGTFTQQIVKSYAEVATSPIVLQPVIEQLGLRETPQQLAKRVTATAALDTVIIDISAEDPGASRARRIAEAVTEQLSTAVDSLTTVRSDAAAVTVTRIQAATLASSPVGLPAPAAGALGLLVGALVGALVASIAEAARRRIHSTRDAGRASGLPLVVGLPRPPGRPGGAGPVVLGHQGADGYRMLRADLRTAAPDFRSVCVVATTRGSGATRTAANLAIALAEGGAEVALVEANLRHPSLAHFLDVAAPAGLADVLADGVDLDSAMIPSSVPGLQVLVAGGSPQNATDLLQGPRMHAVMEQLTARFDMVVYDVPTALESSDAGVVAARSAIALLVCGAGRTRVDSLQQSVEAMTRYGAAVAGLVVTGLPRRGLDAPTVLT